MTFGINDVQSSVVMPTVAGFIAMLSVILLNVLMLSVVAPFFVEALRSWNLARSDVFKIHVCSLLMFGIS